MADTSISGLALGSIRHLFWYSLLVIAFITSHASALNFVSGGRCGPQCSDSVAGTIHDNVACLDDQYDQFPARHLKECISCQLNSTAVDPATNVTDVQWGLFHLRYALSNCMFAYPEVRVSISSPCQVTCAPLRSAVVHGITNSTTTTNYSADLGFCTDGQFDHATLNNCAFCYSFIPQQLILGNFLQALHIACYSAPMVGKAFYPDGVAIFNRSTIAGPTGQNPSPPSHKLTGQALILAIVLPSIVGALFVAAACGGCWFFSRRRRERMTATARMLKSHDGNFSEYNPMTPRNALPRTWPWQEPAREMQSISVLPKSAESPATGIPVQQRHDIRAPGHWPVQKQVNTSMTHSDTDVEGGPDNNSSNISDVKDPYLHERFLGSDR